MNVLAELPNLIAQTTQPATAAAAGGDEYWWVTLAAQIFNFLLLVFLLWFFLFRRITEAMDRREKKIASHFEEAEQANKEAAARAEDLRLEREKLEKQRRKFLDDAKAAADEQRRTLTEQAREQVQTEADRWHADLQREKKSFLQRISRMAGEQACALARKALKDLADAELEGRMIDVLIGRLADVPEKERTELADAARESGEPLVVATAWDVPAADRSKVTRAVREHLLDGGEVNYETDATLACGIELRAGGREIGWTLDGYVRGIRDAISAAVDEQIAAAVPIAEPQAEGAEEDAEADRKSQGKEPKRKRPPSRKSQDKADAKAKGEDDEDA